MNTSVWSSVLCTALLLQKLHRHNLGVVDVDVVVVPLLLAVVIVLAVLLLRLVLASSLAFARD